MSSSESLDARSLARLLEVGRGLLSELDLDVVLDRVAQAAVELTAARYAAINVLAPGGEEQTQSAIEDRPEGRATLLMPIVVRGDTWGQLTLAEKDGGDYFSAEDEQAAGVLCEWAAVAIDNARLYQSATARRDELARNVRGLEATAALARAIGAESDLEAVLALVVTRGRALIGARDLLVLLRDGDELVVAADGGRHSIAPDRRVAIDESTAGQVLAERHSRRVADARNELKVPATRLGVAEASTALMVPLVHGGEALGVLAAFDRVDEDVQFTRDDELLLESFATHAASALATARTVGKDRLRRSMDAAEASRRRWARELHDETLQALGALKLVLSSATRLDDPEEMRAVVRGVLDQLGDDIGSLRDMISELQPAVLDQLGLEPALTSLLQRTAATTGLDVRATIDLPDNVELSPETTTTVYRVVQESLSNVARHALAEVVEVEVRVEQGAVVLGVVDDGTGFDPAQVGAAGHGLASMRERVELAGGTLAIGPAEGWGTTVRARLPLS
jgi:signal transduction histidine kinase